MTGNAADVATSFGQAVVLHVQDGQYAVAIGRVQVIVRVPTITRVPRAQVDVRHALRPVVPARQTTITKNQLVCS